MNHHEHHVPEDEPSLAGEIVRFFEVFDDHFMDDPDFDPMLPLDENINGHTRTLSWTKVIDGMPVEFKCRRVVYNSSHQWITYEDGVRQVAPHKPFDPVRCASALKRAIESKKHMQKEGA